ncbi:MAG TPA: thiamine pyrophosphate-dependent enzyme [Bacteroidia bacterium]|jgi:pyruvate/2-oxoglutarate/acetoin dehydrogenase E1 component/TPP-dependent pyruvate/acetoin dehydrogenase alpha subunit|nr:thiamine pyrophosphate-dependent enzyme [Bacteroidia bacterium]
MTKVAEQTFSVSKEKAEEFRKLVLQDYLIVVESREASLTGRKEVLTGKAKFGIFGDGKEVAQVAMAKVFREGDFRSGYYRDQTFMLATGNLTVQEWFAQLYAHTDVNAEPSSAGRQMNGHFATRSLNEDGSWKDLTKIKNSSSDISPTGSQMPRLLGLALASKHYRLSTELHNAKFAGFSNNGNEIAFGTIGDASTSEGLFWETVNAAGVMQIPMLISVWDDGYGISVPKKYQTTKESISDALSGFQRTESHRGFQILKTKGWNYPHLVETYEKAAKICREEHVPVLVHVEEVNQPQGHSTSGSHERYKTPERLQWEQDFDCIKKFREWIESAGLATNAELDEIEKTAKEKVKNERRAAWDNYLSPIKSELKEALALLDALANESANKPFIEKVRNGLSSAMDPVRRDITAAIRTALRFAKKENTASRTALINWLNAYNTKNNERYSSLLYSGTAMNVPVQLPSYSAEEKFCDGREVLRDNFDSILSRYPEVCIFGEDSGYIGGVNQGLEGLQKKYGILRVFDTGIREATIVGQAIGMAMRGLRPIAEIQYLDYLLYALQIMSDDLSTVQWRTIGGQKAPVIIRTRGHRLEGVWHSGSPMGMIIHAVRGMYVCVPRNMTVAAGFYNTLLKGDEPALVIEPLNGYRLKEKTPTNWGEFTSPLGVPEIILEGKDITLVSYGSTLRLAMDAAKQLQEANISVEIIDVQTLLPFDIHHRIVESVKKTNRLIVVDEDVPGGASAYILQHIIEEQKAYQYLDSAPVTLAAKEHRPAYGSDGDYFSKPSTEDIYDAVYNVMHEVDPQQWPAIY